MGVPLRQPPHSITLASLPVTALNRRQWAERMIIDHAEAEPDERPWLLSSANGHVLSRYATDPAFRRLMTQMDAVDADGMPLVLASRLLSREPLPERVATTDFFHDAALAAQQTGLTFFLLGGTAQENSAACARVAKLYPKLKVFGHHGYFAPSEEPEIIAHIRACGTHVLWVGLGVPAEQAFAIRNSNALKGLTWIKTCGGLFNFLSGSARRAPHWMQVMGLEWLYRLGREPRRLFWRYASTNTHCIWLLFKDAIMRIKASL